MAKREVFMNDFGIALDTKNDVKKPKMYKVILHNDNYTTMNFVVLILKEVFNKTTTAAEKLMKDVHHKGKAVVGIYTYDIALTKTEQVHTLAKNNDFPLKCTFEEA